MKKFRFNLETVLDYRQQKEEQELQKLAKANRTYALVQNHLTKLQERLIQEQEATEQRLTQGANLNLLEAWQRVLYIENLQQSVAEQKQRLQQAQREVKRCQERVIKAHQETKVLENLKQKRWEEYWAEVNKKEQ